MSDFTSITSNDSWFKKHPEKIAGVEFESTSFMFPIQVKGDKEDVLRVTAATVATGSSEIDNLALKVKIAKAKAIAIQINRKR